MIKSQIPNPKSQTNPNYQNPNGQDKRCLKFGIWRLFVIWCLLLGTSPLFAQEDNKLTALTKQIIEAKNNEDLYVPFAELKDLYLEDNKYAEFVGCLKSLSQKKSALEPFTNYYIALARYSQLKYLEEKQVWDEYFSQGNAYRQEIATAAQKTIGAVTAKDLLGIYARLILWQFHKDQQDVFVEETLSDLMNSILEYAKTASDTKPVKEVADKLLSYGEKGKSKELYKIYVDKIIASNMKDDALKNLASGFYAEGNLELAEAIYDVYVDRISGSTPKEKLIAVLIDIAKLFSYKDEGQKDAFYAEKTFQKIEEMGTKAIFDEELIYLRAFNLEKAKDYPKARDVYIDLALTYPEGSHADEALFKIGIINAYVLRDIKQARSYFEKLAHSTTLSANPEPVEGLAHSTPLSANPEPVEGLAQKTTLSPQVISGLYQLGLLSQWENDVTAAKDYYNKLIEKAGDNFQETVMLARERLKEIDGLRHIEYNLKTFLDVSLKEEYRVLDMTKLDLRSHPYKTKKEGIVSVNSVAYSGQTGCMQVELQYLWSGDVGTAKPPLNKSSFDTTYIESGTKEINLVVVSPAAIIDRNFDLVDVY